MGTKCSITEEKRPSKKFVSFFDKVNKRNKKTYVNEIVDNSTDYRKKTIRQKLKDFDNIINGSAAGIRDMVRDVYDVSKINSRFTAINKDIRKAKSYIKENSGAMSVYNKYRDTRSYLMDARYAAPEETMKTNQYKSYIQDNPKGDVNSFIKFLEESKMESEDIIANNNALTQTHKSMMKIAQDRIDDLKKVDPELNVVGKLFSSMDDPLSVLDEIYSKVKTSQDNEFLSNFYSRAFRVNVKMAVGNPQYMDHVSNHFVDMYKHQLMLHNQIINDKESAKFGQDLINEMKTVDITDPTVINKLPDGHPLKESFIDVHNQILKNESYKRIFDATYDKDKSFIDNIYDSLDLISARSVVFSNRFLRTTKNTSIIKNNRSELPNLYKLISNGKPDYGKISSEIEHMNKLYGTKNILNKNELNQVFQNNTLKDTLRSEIGKYNLGQAQDLLSRLSDRYPDYTICTSNGTKVMRINGKISDIENNKEVLGHLVDLSDPSFMADDIVTMKLLQEQKEEALFKMIADGRLGLVKNKNADMLSRFKKEMTTPIVRGKFGSLTGMFSMYTLFSPINYPGYALTTQIPGNVSHTIMADPSAFKHWRKFTKEIKNVWRGEWNKIEDQDVRRIARLLTTSEGASLHGMTKETFEKFDGEAFFDDMNDLVEKGNEKLIAKKLKEYTETVTGVASVIEMVSRGAMAYEILSKKRVDNPAFAPSTSNPKRVEYLWGVDDHLAAVRMANDTHIDYSNLPRWVRKLSMYSPFMSFKVGSGINYYRWGKNTYDAVAKAARGETDWSKARSYLGRGAIGIAWRAGVAATVWNLLMGQLGLLSDDRRKYNNKLMGNNIFTQMSNSLGLKMDNNFFIPGTGVKSIDTILRLDRANNKGDTFNSFEALLPGVDQQWRDAWDGKLYKGVSGLDAVIRLSSAKTMSSATPLIKTPTELMLGGGTIYDDGYHPPSYDHHMSESVVNGFASFWGMNKVSRLAFDAYYKRSSSYYDQSAYGINDWNTRFYEQYKSGSSVNDQYKGMIRSKLSHMDGAGLIDSLRQYEHYLEQQGLPQSEVESKVHSMVDSMTLAKRIKQNPDYIKGLSQNDKESLQKSLDAQQSFLQSLGLI